MNKIFLGMVMIVAIVRMGMAVPESEPRGEKEVFWMRNQLQIKLAKWLPGDSGALAVGLLLGGDEDLSYETRKNFRWAGLSHVTAASGYNVVVVAGWVMGALGRWMHKRLSIYIGIVCTILYMLLAGMTVPVIRAGLMVILAYAGLAAGRKTDGWWGLTIICLIMIIYNPVWVFDISFQLSVTATAGVLWAVGTGWEGWWGKGVIADLRTSLAAWVMTMPIILHYFGQLSLVAPLANLGVVWIVPLIMEVLGAAVAIGVLWEGGGWLVSLVAWPGLKYMLEATKWFASLPGASFEAGKMGWGWVVGCYLALFLMTKRYGSIREEKGRG